MTPPGFLPSAGESKHHRRGGRPGFYWSEHWPVWICATCCHLFNAARCEVYNPHPHPRHSCSEYATHTRGEAGLKAAFPLTYSKVILHANTYLELLFFFFLPNIYRQGCKMYWAESKFAPKCFCMCLILGGAFVPTLTGVRDEVWNPAHFPWGFASGRRELFWLPWQPG